MGNRSLIAIRSAEQGNKEIRFYGHWSGKDNVEAVRNVLARTDRIGDVSYITAQIFHEFSVNLGGYDGNLSFGIYLCDIGDDEGWTDNETVYVNADNGDYEYNGTLYRYAEEKPEPNVVYEVAE